MLRAILPCRRLPLRLKTEGKPLSKCEMVAEELISLFAQSKQIDSEPAHGWLAERNKRKKCSGQKAGAIVSLLANERFSAAGC